ncbi:MAG: hypothetical protein C7B43_13840 [Sulfobacillus benefaciens]|uniref:Cas12f1-like TNB domain-containing protein n=1 Tax=Sulfobacillus benefaciens TaxID=453960 RepID=A0A2T2WW09_9FIRM|nr:MAG: hypothetical protein C7B43_13840 [Sulfobacillus benefaciens]HBQ95683.1 hypothetical protein [Sulfobacillus sp.]
MRQLEYQAPWYGRRVVTMNKFTSSSTRCFDCGHVTPKRPLHSQLDVSRKRRISRPRYQCHTTSYPQGLRC